MNKFLASALVLALPAITLAQDSQRVGFTIKKILNFFGEVVNFLGPFLIAVALLAFFASLVAYLFKKEEIPASKDYLKYSILILFVMVSIWGIIAFLQDNLGIESGTDVDKNPTSQVKVQPIY